MRAKTWGWGIGIAVAFALPRGARGGDDVTKPIENVTESIDHGDPALAMKHCSDDLRTELVADPNTIYRLCRRAYRSVGIMVKRGTEPTDKLVLWLFDTAKAARDAVPADPV